MTLVQRLLVLAGSVAALRIFVLWLTPTDLFFDEAQYWAWSQNIDWGYFSKPPLIAWVIRIATEIGGSDAPFWVRIAAPIFHSLTAVILGLWVGEVKPAAAIWAAAIYLSMPILAVGSWMISTDTVMAPFLAGALWAWWRHLHTGSLNAALVAGLLVGLATLAKYAGAYFWLIVVVNVLFGGARPRPPGVLLAIATFGLVISPNMIWNLQNGFITFAHTAENASWDAGINFNWTSMMEFVAAQVMVFGPVMFIFWLAALGFRKSRFDTFLICGSLPILLLVTGQAFISQAYANWAFAAYLSAAPLVAISLVRSERRTWLRAGLALNVAISIVAVALIVAPRLSPPIMDRYLGRDALMDALIQTADGRAMAATERQLLADLTYAATRDGRGGQVFAFERNEPATNWYEMNAERPTSTPVLLITQGAGPVCGSGPAQLEGVARPQSGAYLGREFFLFSVPAGC
tara:strand:- start:1638 stop:3020 length:1383 start_codon:yes stop_codon:yes gene_type:complete